MAADNAIAKVEARAEALLALHLNGVPQDDAVHVLVQPGNGAVALQCDDWDALHLARASGAGDLQHGDRCWRPLATLPALRWRIDDASQTLMVDAPPTVFAGSRLAMGPVAPAVTPATRWGGFANYDVQWQRSATPGLDGRSASTRALLELGTFGPAGSGRISGLARDDGMQPRFLRLDTSWTRDTPEQMASLRLGDTIGKAGTWGRPMRFGGVQWATDFTTQPGFLTFPLPAMRGEAALPSTVDVYVNNSRRVQSNVPAGPFELTDLPIVTGSGQVRVVVRDLLGREQVIVQPYYGTPTLLRPGLRAFSYEIGVVREDYGLASSRYGRPIASATERLGITDTFTREWRAELLGRQAAIGATGMWQLGSFGIGSLSAVASHSADAGSGALSAAAVDYQGVQWNGSLQVRQSSRHFTQSGQGPEGPMRLQTTLSVGGVVSGTPIGMSIVAQRPWNGEPQRLVSLTLSHSLGGSASLGLFALHDLVSRATTVALNLSVALDGRTSAAVSATSNRDPQHATSAAQLQLQRSIPEGRGFGYNVVADESDTRRFMAQASLLTDVAEFNAGAARSMSSASTDWRAGIAGGVAWLDDSFFLSRRIDGSFAVVSVGDYPGVQVLHDHRPVARTDAHGRALVPGLRGYDTNRIGIDAADLPFDADVEALEVDVTPPARSGVVLDIPVRRNRSASLRLVDRDGKPVPVGSVLQLAGRSQQFPVGFDGRAFVSGLAARTPARVRWPGGECKAMLALAPESDDLPELGTVACL